jgi:hypothetical protein
MRRDWVDWFLDIIKSGTFREFVGTALIASLFLSGIIVVLCYFITLGTPE